MEFAAFSTEDHQTWFQLFDRLDFSRQQQAHPLYAEGLEKLGITAQKVPKMSEINAKLKKLTGWKAVPAEGLVDGANFFQGLARREFPVGNFIRDRRDLAYTPAPDVFHDLYGHIPFFADQDYADFCQAYGESAQRYAQSSAALREYERLFWFGVEFPLIKTKAGLRIFGGGILSSVGECDYCLSAAPTKLPFDVEVIRKREYRIDIMQETLFVLDSKEQLYRCIPQLEAGIRRDF